MTRALLTVGICQMAIFAKPKKVLHLYGFGERPHRQSYLPTITLLDELSKEHGFTLTHARESNALDSIQDYDVVLFNNTAFGSFTKEAEQEKLIEWMTGGGKAIGFCHTCDVRGKWDWWGDVMCGGAWYDTDFTNPLTLNRDTEIEHIPALKAAWDANNLGEQIEFPKTEIFVFNENPRGKEDVTILLTVDQAHTDIADHPSAWHKKVGQGEFIYTALGSGHFNAADFSTGWMKKATWAWIQYLTGDFDESVDLKQNAPSARLEIGKRRIHIKDDGPHSVRIFDIQGRLCEHWSGSGEMAYPLHGLKTGIYHLQVKSGNFNYTRPFTIL